MNEKCPFCKGSADLAIDGKLYCKKCLVCPFFTPDEWNNRADMIEIRQLREEIEKLKHKD